MPQLQPTYEALDAVARAVLPSQAADAVANNTNAVGFDSLSCAFLKTLHTVPTQYHQPVWTAIDRLSALDFIHLAMCVWHAHFLTV